tara:strand:+ start:366 stop:518 length:153 start_codon:yes stop_codon:yes gene_type:complete
VVVQLLVFKKELQVLQQLTLVVEVVVLQVELVLLVQVVQELLLLDINFSS